MPLIETVIFSSAAAFATRLVVHPLDTLKIRVQNGTTERSRSVLAVLRNTKHLSSLYNGLSVTLALSVPGLAVYLSTYEVSKYNIGMALSTDGQPQSNVLVHALAGTIAECFSGVIWTPMEVMKSKLQVETAEVTTNATVELAKKIYREEGMRGFFRGYFVTLSVFIPQTVIYFVTYEQLKAYSLSHSDTIPHYIGYLGSAAIASTISSSISNIFDVVKTRIQVADGSDHRYQRVFSVASDMYRNEGGFAAFTRGVTARVISIVPSSMLSMTIFEVLKEIYGSKR
ncbi:hypothetical protein HDU98_000767 [Podochytrium sp. JEL0797]|nr:hypothetical protein HDU98_000767 [Podochytrium sp. JEL0797]